MPPPATTKAPVKEDQMAVEDPVNDAIALNSEIPADVPDWVMILRTGTWRGHPAGPEVVTPLHLHAAADAFARNYTAHGNDLAIDYHHQSVLAAEGRAPRAPAAGWVKEFELRADGTELWARVQPWVADASAAIAARQYRYLSPVLLFGRPDPVTAEIVPLQIHSIALTNTPFLTSLEALNQAATDGGAPPGRPDGGPSTGGGESMHVLNALADALGKTPEEVASSLGLNAGAENKAVAEGVIALAARVNELEASNGEDEGQQAVVNDSIAALLGVDAGSAETAVKASILRLQADSGMDAVCNAIGLPADAKDDAVLARLNELVVARRKSEAEELVDGAVEAGKVTPATKGFWLNAAGADIEAAREAINALPVLTGAQPHGNPVDTGGPRALTQEQQSVCALLNVSEKTFAAGA